MLAIGLFWLGVVLVFSAILMLFWDSFKQRKLWGLAGLLFLVPLVIHAVMSWSALSVRKAVYVLILGILTLTVSIAGGALTHLPFLADNEVVQVLEENIAPPREEQPLPNQEQADAAAQAVEENYDPLLTGSEYEDLETKELAPEAVNLTNPRATAARYQRLNDSERAYAMNKRIRLKLTDGEIIEGRLTNIRDDSVLVESLVNGGVLGLSYNNNDIAEMFVRLEAGEDLPKPDIEEQVEEAAQNLETNVDTSPQSVQQAGQPSTTIKEAEVQLEEIRPEIREQEVLPAEPATEEVLEKIDTMVDDSKSVENPLGQ